MTWQNITRIVIIAAGLGLAAYDIIAVINGGLPATISQVLYNGAREEPLIAFAFGVLFGHLFWPQDLSPEKLVRNVKVIFGKKN